MCTISGSLERRGMLGQPRRRLAEHHTDLAAQRIPSAAPTHMLAHCGVTRCLEAMSPAMTCPEFKPHPHFERNTSRLASSAASCLASS